MKKKQEIKVIHSADEDKFTEQVNNLLNEGWQIESTSCGFAIKQLLTV